jgi:hypothetical protein
MSQPADTRLPIRRRGVRYSEAVAAAICERMAAGEPWSRISEDPAMPTYTALYVWKKKHPGFADQVRVAQEAAADRHMDQALAIADEVTKDTVTQARVRIDTLKSRTARLDAAAKGEGGKDAPRRTVFNIKIVRFGQFEDDDNAGD